MVAVVEQTGAAPMLQFLGLSGAVLTQGARSGTFFMADAR